MKKLIIGAVLTGLVITPFLLLYSPRVVSAEASLVPKVSECCKVKHTITLSSGSIPKDTVVGSEAASLNSSLCRFGNVTAKENWGMYCMVDTVMTITDWIFYIFMMVVVIMLIIAGFMFVTSNGKPENVGKARSLLVYAIIGLIIGLLARAIPSIVRFFLGM